MPPRRVFPSHSLPRANSRTLTSPASLEPTTNGPAIPQEEKKPNKMATPGLPYTAEEIRFLDDLRSPSREQKLLRLKDSWSSGPELELLAGLTEKALTMAMLQICETSPPPTEAAQTNVSTNLTSSATTGDSCRKENPLRLPTASDAGSITEVVESFSGHLTPAQFSEENTYIVEQLRALPECPFTIERLVEILDNPFKYHTGEGGGLRGEALQKSIRRCVMVTFPFAGITNQTGA